MEINGERGALLPHCKTFLEPLLRNILPALEESDPTLYQAIVLHVLSDAIEAFSYMHHIEKHTHGDPKPANLVLHKGDWCLCDLDNTHEFGSEPEEDVGSAHYSHPACLEQLKNRSNPCADLYGLGMTLKDLLLKPQNFEKKSYLDQIEEKKELQAKRFHLTQEESSAYYESIRKKSIPDALYCLADELCSCPLFIKTDPLISNEEAEKADPLISHVEGVEADPSILNGLAAFVKELKNKLAPTQEERKQLDEDLTLIYNEGGGENEVKFFRTDQTNSAEPAKLVDSPTSSYHNQSTLRASITSIVSGSTYCRRTSDTSTLGQSFNQSTTLSNDVSDAEARKSDSKPQC